MAFQRTTPTVNGATPMMSGADADFTIRTGTLPTATPVFDSKVHEEMAAMLCERKTAQDAVAPVLIAPSSCRFRLPEPRIDPTSRVVHRNGKGFPVEHPEVCPECDSVSLAMGKGERFCSNCGLVVGVEGINLRTCNEQAVLKAPRRAVELGNEASLFGENYRLENFIGHEEEPLEEQNDW